MDESLRPWMRRERETEPAYRAFQVYMRVRTLQKVCEETGKSWQLISKWSAQWSWVERVRSFDCHLDEAQTDGLIHQLAESRDKNLALVDKLRDHLSNRLDEFITRNQDPSVRWTQALTAMAKLEQNALVLKEDRKTNEQVAKLEDILARLDEYEDKM